MKVLYEDDLLPLGKYKGRVVSSIIEDDPKYLIWFQANTDKAALSDEVMEKVCQVTGRSMDVQ